MQIKSNDSCDAELIEMVFKIDIFQSLTYIKK